MIPVGPLASSSAEAATETPAIPTMKLGLFPRFPALFVANYPNPFTLPLFRLDLRQLARGEDHLVR